MGEGALTSIVALGDRSSRSCRLTSVGDNCIDDYGDRLFVGGNALNVAIQWSAAGVPSAYFGAVGDDEAGLRVRTVAAGRGVAVEGVIVAEGATATTRLSLEPRGDRTIEHENLGVAAEYRVRPDDVTALGRSRWVHGAMLIDPETVAVEMAAARVPFSYDFSTRLEEELAAPLAAAFYSFDGPPGDEVVNRLRQALARGAESAVGLCGAFGSLVVDGERTVQVPAVDVDVVDTCGAGDSYIARFALARAEGRSLEVSARLATRAASFTCTYRGAWPQEPLDPPVTGSFPSKSTAVTKEGVRVELQS